MNTTNSVNKTSTLIYECFNSYPGILIGLSSLSVDLLLFVPLHIWTLFVGYCMTKEKGFPASDVFTIALSVMEILSFSGFFLAVISFVFEVSWTIYVALFMLGKYLIGRPLMNSLICVERFVAVVYPIVFRRFNTLRFRLVFVALACLVTWSLASNAIFSYPHMPLQSLSVFLLACLLCITACSLGVLKALLRPTLGNKEKKGMDNKKKRTFMVITRILLELFQSYILCMIIAMIKTYIPYDTFCLLGGIVMWFLRPSSAIQPLLYLSKYNKLPWIQKNMKKSNDLK